ncbi:hypothetical protein MP478_10980 [Chryseobacterium sp. WG14]|uniref:hypothetical protein n=1 Tax=Chryseobacterium sp. WG14 TaxID=2926909 RepID=UPI00211E3B7F|nr:hypothetical protein [Chryseobacterium sp. WG14]MCQ9639907.1 hypothetical protein [Chryseobacterium sp. WG14]
MADIKKITNEELFEELKSRGFTLISDGRKEMDSMVVSVKPFQKDVYYTFQKDWYKCVRGSGSN